jgi:hypothetical protein
LRGPARAWYLERVGTSVGIGLVLLVAGGPVPAAIGVRAETTCPTASEVSAALEGLVAPPAPPAAPDVVELAGQGPSITVTLRSAAGQVIAEKRLPGSPSCQERARAAAVIVAAWEAHLRAGAAPAWPPESRPPPPAAPDATVRAPAPPPAPEPIRVATSAAVMLSVAAGGASPAGMVEGTFSRGRSRFALGVGALVVGAHSTPVATGRGTWRRIGGLVDLQSGVSWQAVELQLHGGVALTAVSVMGESLPLVSGGTIFDPGGLAGLRLRLRGQRLSPWLEAAAAYWPSTHTLSVVGSPDLAQLPAFEAFVGIGVSLGENR